MTRRCSVLAEVMVRMATLLILASSARTWTTGFVIPSSSSRSGWFGVSSSRLCLAQQRGRPRGPLRTVEQKPPMNHEISQSTLRVVTVSGRGKDEALGVMTKSEALRVAKEMGDLDLILINSNSDPVVCKIADYSKFRYEKEKKAKELKKKNATGSTELKEIKMSYKIDTHDYQVRVKSASKFLTQGNRVKATIQFKGREVQHDNLGFDLLNRLAKDMDKLCIMEAKPKRDGRTLSCIVSPRPEVVKAVHSERRAAEKAKKRAKAAGKNTPNSHNDLNTTAIADTVATVDENGNDTNLHDDDNDDLYDDDTDEDNDSDTDDDQDDDSSLDELLSGDDLTDDLFG